MEKASKINVFSGRERGTKSKNQILTGSKGADTQNISALSLFPHAMGTKNLWRFLRPFWKGAGHMKLREKEKRMVYQIESTNQNVALNEIYMTWRYTRSQATMLMYGKVTYKHLIDSCPVIP